MRDKEIDNLFRQFDKAEHALIKKRDELFPAGTVVKSRIAPDMVAIVKCGSLYAHQVNTQWGHMSWRYLEKVEGDSK